MKTLLLIDANSTRCTWLSAELELLGFLVLGTVSTLEAALNNITRCRPQIVLVAPKVADVSGASLTRNIMENHPVPVILLTDSHTVTNQDVQWCGATATFETPVDPGLPQHRNQMKELAQKLNLMSEVPVIKRRSTCTAAVSDHNRVTEQKLNKLSLSPLKLTATASQDSKTNLRHAFPKATISPLLPNAHNTNALPPLLIGIATSTGGPVVVQKILSALPANYPIPIVVIQHLIKGFSDTLIKWLDSGLALKVVEAHNGDIARPGYVYVVAGQQHAILSSGLQIQLLPSDRYPGHCPSGTVFFNSMAAILGAQTLGIVLTGMGDDGSEGLLTIRRSGGQTYAQEESTCTMASMPHEAISLGAACYTLSPEGIGIHLQRYCTNKGSEA